MGEDVEKESLSCKQSNAGERLVQKEPQRHAGIKLVQIESGNVKQSNASESLVQKGKQQQICSSSEKIDWWRRFESVVQQEDIYKMWL